MSPDTAQVSKLSGEGCVKALEYKVGRVLAPSIEFICFVYQIHISVLVIKLPYLELNIQNQWLTLIGYKI